MDKVQRIDRIIQDLKALAPTGFAAAFIVEFAAPRYLFQTYDLEWKNHYSSTGMVMLDPAVRWGFVNDGIADLDALVAMDEADVFGQAREYGLIHWAVVATSDGGKKSFGAFSRPDAPYEVDEQARILALLTEAHWLAIAATEDDALATHLKDLSRQLTQQ